MKLAEIIENVVPFTRKRQRSNVIGKVGGKLVRQDEITGQPYVTNRHDVAFNVDPDTYELPSHYNEDPPEQEWLVLDKDNGTALSYHTSEKDADLEVKKQRRWHRKNATVHPLLP